MESNSENVKKVYALVDENGDVWSMSWRKPCIYSQLRHAKSARTQMDREDIRKAKIAEFVYNGIVEE